MRDTQNGRQEGGLTFSRLRVANLCGARGLENTLGPVHDVGWGAQMNWGRAVVFLCST